MRRLLSCGMICMIAVCLALTLVACKDQQTEPPTDSRPSYDADKLSDYVQLDAYTDLKIPLKAENASKGEAVWEAILARAQVMSYPEEAVSYYAEQERQACRYYAKENDVSYEDAMNALGLTEDGILAQAKQMVKSDLVYEYIRADAEISLTEKEKSDLFDRYASRLAVQHGYETSYVKEQMASLVYETMLYDKTMEYLIVHNEFIVAE